MTKNKNQLYLRAGKNNKKEFTEMVNDLEQLARQSPYQPSVNQYCIETLREHIRLCKALERREPRDQTI